MESPKNEVSDSQAPESGEQLEYEEFRLIDAMENAISKLKAAFCCGGQVPIMAIADEGEEHRFDDVAGVITSPPVVLLWDLTSGTYISCKASVLYYSFSFGSISGSKSMSDGCPGLQECHAYRGYVFIE